MQVMLLNSLKWRETAGWSSVMSHWRNIIELWSCVCTVDSLGADLNEEWMLDLFFRKLHLFTFTSYSFLLFTMTPLLFLHVVIRGTDFILTTVTQFLEVVNVCKCNYVWFWAQQTEKGEESHCERWCWITVLGLHNHRPACSGFIPSRCE